MVTHYLVTAEDMKRLEWQLDNLGKLGFTPDAIELDLSPATLETTATNLYTTHSAIGNNTFFNKISFDGFMDAIKHILNSKKSS
jgi:hypothetical protein